MCIRDSVYHHGSNAVLASATEGELWTASVWVRADVETSVELFIFGLNSDYNHFSGSYKTTGPVIADARWKRLVITHTMPTGVEYIATRVDVNTPGTSAYFWGWQVEKKSFPTSFVDGSRQEGRLVVHQSGLELIHFWAKFQGIGTGNFVFCTVYSYDVPGNKLWIDPDGYLNYRQGSSGITTSIQIQKDVWYMFVWDLKNNRLFVGNASNSDDIHFINHSTNITVNGDEVTLGCNSGGSYGYSVVGSTLLANVVFSYNADYWTDSYIQEVYNARAPFAK